MAGVVGSQSRNRWVCLGASALVAVLPIVTGMLTGCQNVQGASPQTFVRVIDASYNAPAVDVSVGTTPIATNIAAQTITHYAFLTPQNGTAWVYPAKTTKATASASADFLPAQEYSVFLTDSGASYAATVLSDQITPPPAGYFAVRFLQQARTTGPVDIYLVPDADTLSGSKPLLSHVAAGTLSGYINVTAGTYSVVVTPAGVTTTPYTSASMTIAAGAVRTMLIMDAQLTTNPPVTVIVGSDLN